MKRKPAQMPKVKSRPELKQVRPSHYVFANANNEALHVEVVAHLEDDDGELWELRPEGLLSTTELKTFLDDMARVLIVRGAVKVRVPSCGE